MAPFWYHRFSPKCCGADFGSRVKSPGHLLGQSEQNFEIYTVDWSQVSVWGLAAGGEALRIARGDYEYLSSPNLSDRAVGVGGGSLGECLIQIAS